MKLVKVNDKPQAVISTEADLKNWEKQLPLWQARGYDIQIVNLIPCPSGCMHIEKESKGWVEEGTK